MEALGLSPREEAHLRTLIEEVSKSSEIEGEHLDQKQVRSSIARKRGHAIQMELVRARARATARRVVIEVFKDEIVAVAAKHDIVAAAVMEGVSSGAPGNDVIAAIAVDEVFPSRR